jgi:hypothetical protein
MKASKLFTNWEDKTTYFTVDNDETTAIIKDIKNKKVYHVNVEQITEMWYSGKSYEDITTYIFRKQMPHKSSHSANAWNTIEYLVDEWCYNESK